MMRHLFPLLALPAALIIYAETAQALDPSEISQIAKPVTVRLSVRTESGSGIGSGVIIKKEDNTYHVLTARHVVEDALEGYLFTPENPEDGYEFNPRATQIIAGVDLAVVQFTSSKNYPVAKLGDSEKLSEGNSVFVTGFPDATYTDN
ncbi:MAG: serine protease, partial [Spirulinaceae cyanobacterium]